ncbi:MAG TPA: hypothetical protein VMX17_05535 [Candidatus Glassbacteria bacterium]|nr:hypothetical protein [Candidatus Glassbacteria bacterium]
MSVDIDSLDDVKLKKDTNEMLNISDELPEDGIIDIGDTERLAGLSMRGMTICDYWVPVMMVIVGEAESKRDIKKAKAYLGATSDGGKMTAEARKQFAEADDDYNKARLAAVRFKSVLEHFKKKWSSFEKFHHWMKDIQRTYDYKGGRHISGEELEFKKEIKEKPKSKSPEEQW